MSVHESIKRLGRPGRGQLTKLDLSDPSAAAVPERVGKYDVQAEIGRGALVRVFRAFDPETGRPVTLKVTTGHADSTLIQRFRDEVAVVAKLRHPNTVAIYELGVCAGLPFAVSPSFADDLHHTIQTRQPLDLLQKTNIMWQAAQGLDALHRAGIGYAGVRPSGIALGSDGGVTVKDFGVVRLTPEDDAPHEAYRSPEEAEGRAPDRLSDIFAFGALYYELLTGSRFAGESQRLRELVPDCPEALENLICRALERSRELRYPNFEELQCDAEPVIGSLKRTQVAVLLIPARQFVEAGELTRAQQVIADILQLDPDNRVAHRLRSELRSRLHRGTVAAQIPGLYSEADQAVSNRHWDRALEILKSASRLDPGNSETNSRLKNLQSQLERARASDDQVREARRLFDDQRLTEARGKLLEAIANDPGGEEAPKFLETVVDSIIRRETEARIEQAVAKARALLSAEAFDEAVSALTPLHAEHPESPVVSEWLDRIQNEKNRAERLHRLTVGLRDARALLQQSRLAEAGALLEPLAADFPDETEVAHLFAAARREMERIRIVSDAIARCKEHRAAAEFDAAGAAIDEALALYPENELLLRVRAETAEAFRKAGEDARVKQVLEEAQWLVDRGRPDLAIQVLRERSAGLPERPELASRLASVEAGLPEWHTRRAVQDVLARVAALEQFQDSAVALAVLEEAVHLYPGYGELESALEQLRGRVREQERQKKRARRLEAIRQRMAAQAWPEALSLLESARAEFPEEPEFESRLREARDEISRSECERAIAEVRQLLAERETEQAQEALQRAIVCLGDNPALEVVRQEIADWKKDEEDWKQAQIAFGRRHFEEAERLLQGLVERNRPEALALLETVRETCALSAEEEFYERGRDKAAKLIRDGDFEQAADLLRNLLALFPADAILERHLKTAQLGCPRQVEAATSADEQGTTETEVAAVEHPAPPPPPVRSTAGPAAGSGIRRIVWSAAALAVMACCAAVISFSTRSGNRPSRPPAALVVAAPAAHPATAAPPLQEAPPPVGLPAIPAPVERATVRGGNSKSQARSPSTPRAFAFSPGVGAHRELPAATALVMPQDVGVVPDSRTPLLPGRVPGLASVPAPTPPEHQSSARVESPAPVVVGGKVEPARPLRTPPPKAPEMAATRGVYGAVELEATVSRDGKVTRVTTVRGHPLLVQAARNAVLGWQFRPATLNGQPIETTAAVRVVFEARR